MGECRFIQGDVPEEGMQRAQAVVSCPHTVSPIPFKVFKEFLQESRVEFLQSEAARLPAKILRGKTQQQSKCIPVAGYCVRAGAKLVDQPIGEEPLKKR
jgi:hypothetical protein